MKQRALLALILAAGLVGIAGCSQDASTPQDGAETKLTVALTALPPTVDAVVSTFVPTSWIMRNVLETLVTTDGDLNVAPMLADSWEIADDGLSITFTLRDGVVFHDGSVMTADDVVASMQRWTDVSSQGKSAMPGATWSRVDDSTVKVDMTVKNAVALQVLASGSSNLAGIYPKSIVEGAGEEPIQEVIGTGPYMLDEFRVDESMELSEFDDYSARSEPSSGLAGDRTPQYDTVEFIKVADPQGRLSGAITGQYDIAAASPDDYLTIQGEASLASLLIPSGSMYINYNKAQGPMSDLAIRQAVNAAIGSEAVMQAAYVSEDLYTLRPGIMLETQSAQWDSDADADSYNMNDPELARTMLENSSYDGATVRILAQQSDTGAKAAVVIQQQLEDIGFTTELQVFDTSTYLSKRDQPEAWDLLVAGQNSKTEPSSMIYFSPNFAGWTNDAHLTETLAAYRNSDSLEAAQAMYGDILEAYASYRVMTKIADHKEILVVQKGLESTQVETGIILWTVPLISD